MQKVHKIIYTKWFSVFYLSVFFLGGCSNNSAPQKIHIEFHGHKRTCIIEKPDNNSPPKRSPLLIVLHGHNESAMLIRYRIKNSTAFKRNGMLVAYPNGSGFIRHTWDNFESEIAFLTKLITLLSDKYAVDETRIYLAGFSQGGQLAYKMACKHSDLIAAIAMVGSQIDSDFVNNYCEMKRAVPLIAIHSKIDHACPYDSFTYKGKWFNSVESGVASWAYKSGCSLQPDSVYHDKKYDLGIWKKDNQAIVALWSLAKGGHAWPQGRGLLLLPHFSPSKIINGNDTIVRFLSQHSTMSTTF